MTDRARGRRRAVARTCARILMLAVVTAGAVTMVAPYVWLVVNSLKTVQDFSQHPYSMVPHPITHTAYVRAFTLGRVGIYLYNSLFYAVVATAVQLFLDSLAAFAFARMAFRGRNVLFMLLLATMMLPSAVTLIPTYLIVVKLGIADTRLGVMLPGFAGAFGIFLLRQFFLNIPRDLEDAARIDGCSTFGVYARIILPLARPALITLGLFIFIGAWSNFIWPLVVLTDWDLYPITVGIASFRHEAGIYWNSVFAGSVIASFPLIGLTLLAQRYIIGGITLSGMKG
ncbi:MAG TPA: carbohydrate ABC transporter permease [Candidatus Bathyarchaeia archaeon]|nr:carbohydrate ABC transporter permease [Candidatus Bathyarchaeia archaeon]